MATCRSFLRITASCNAAAALLFIVAMSCTRPMIDADHWRAMPVSEKTLYVRSLLGAETVKGRKGGQTNSFSGDASEYVTRIDAAYARGDRRTPEEIFESMGDPRPQQPRPAAP